MTMTIRRWLALGAVAALGLVGPAQAGDLYLGLGVQGSRALETSDIVGKGGGAELTLGYFFNPRWALELTGLLSDFHNRDVEGSLGGVSLNARFSPLPYERLQPYLKAGIGAYFLQEDHADSGIAGPGANVGGGFEFFLVPGLSIGAEGTWRFITYTDEYVDNGCGYCGPDYFDLPNDLDGTTFSGGVNVTYHFR
jgi:opacity protein-like surface antigen